MSGTNPKMQSCGALVSLLAALCHAVLGLCPSVSELFWSCTLLGWLLPSCYPHLKQRAPFWPQPNPIRVWLYVLRHAQPLHAGRTQRCWLSAGVRMDMQRLRVDKQGWLSLLVNHSSHTMSEEPFADWGSAVCAEGQITQMLLGARHKGYCAW